MPCFPDMTKQFSSILERFFADVAGLTNNEDIACSKRSN
jgi:hypothetical protein